LIEKGADPNAKDDNGWTPLHYAAKMVRTHIVELLIEMGADPNIRNKDGKTSADVAPKVSLNFLEKLRSYLNERMRKGEEPSEMFEIRVPGLLSGESWIVRIKKPGILSPVAGVVESDDGIVCVYSLGTDRAGDYIGERLIRKYRRRLEEAEAKGKEEEEKVWKALNKEKEEARKDYVNRRNFEKHLKKSYKEAFVRLLWFDEVARRISKEHGVEVKVEVADDAECRSGLVSEFNGSNMSEEEKLEKIKKRVEAIIAAYKLAYSAYGTYGWTSEESHKKYLEFRKALLEKSKSTKKT
jgi:hypothetical protein